MDIFKYCFPGNYYFTGHVVTLKMYRLKDIPAFSLLSFLNQKTELPSKYHKLLLSFALSFLFCVYHIEVHLLSAVSFVKH